MKCLLLLLSCAPSIYSMHPQTQRTIADFREKTRTEFYPDVTPVNVDQQEAVTRCFNVLKRLKFYVEPSSELSNTITFADAKKYCEWASLYKNMPLASRWFPVDPAIIKAYINLIMFSMFYPDGSGSVCFGPPEGKEELACYLACQKIWKEKANLDALLGLTTKNYFEIQKQFSAIAAAVAYVKQNPPQRNKLEG